jgi:hypothetical protein
MYIKIAFGVFLSIMISALVACAGEYGLEIKKGSWSKGCSDPFNMGLNSCTPEAVVADFKRYFTGAGDFQIEAVRLAFMHGRIHPASKAETTEFCKGLAEIVTEPKIKREKELLNFVRGVASWAKKAMPLALHDELNRPRLSPDAHKRLERAIKMVE